VPSPLPLTRAGGSRAPRRAIRAGVCVGSWNVNAKPAAARDVRAWLAPAAARWGAGGADVVVLGLQEAVELGAVSVLSDTGKTVMTAFSAALDGEEPSRGGGGGVSPASRALPAPPPPFVLIGHAASFTPY
jgi:hypothetical protein